MPGNHNDKVLSSDLGGLPGPSLILWLDPPTSVTGDTHLCFGRLALLSPTKSNPLIPVSLLSFPVFFQCKRYVGSVGSGAVRGRRFSAAGARSHLTIHKGR
jgi:hypothetical protein